ncbi:hypothetical protein LTR51_008661 [Lithohypha guttulata]|nr:hypothetical protein LTR51_008661 [Lithohypha guttulata]
MPDLSPNPWVAPTCPSGPLQLLPHVRRYHASFEKDCVPVYEALYATTSCIRLHHADSYCHELHRLYQNMCIGYLLQIETTRDLQQQLQWSHHHVRDYWQTLLSFNRSYSDSVLTEFGTNDDYVYLLFRENTPYTMSWFQVLPHSPVFAGFVCPPLQARLRFVRTTLAPPNTPSPAEHGHRNDQTVDDAGEEEEVDDEDADDSPDTSEGDNETDESVVTSPVTAQSLVPPALL